MNISQEDKDKISAAFAYVVAHPEEWNQGRWVCQTAACLGGTMVLQQGYARVPDAFVKQLGYDAYKTDLFVAKEWGGEVRTASAIVNDMLTSLHPDVAYKAIWDARFDTVPNLAQAVSDTMNGIGVVYVVNDERGYYDQSDRDRLHSLQLLYGAIGDEDRNSVGEEKARRALLEEGVYTDGRYRLRVATDEDASLTPDQDA